MSPNWLSAALLFYPIAIIALYAYDPRRAFLIFFATKFTMDMFWSEAVVGHVTVLQVMGVVFPLLCLLFYFQNRPSLKDHALMMPIVAVTAMNIIASLWGYFNSRYEFFYLPASPLTFLKIADWNLRFTAQIAAVLIIPIVFKTAEDRALVFKAFLFSTIAPCLIGLFQVTEISMAQLILNVDHSYSASLFKRVQGFYHDAGTLSLVMFTAVILSAFLYFSESSRLFRLVYGVYFWMCNIVLYFTFTRTLWLGTAAFLILFLLVKKRYSLAAGWIAGIVALTAIVPMTAKRFEHELVFFSNYQFLTEHPDELKKLGGGRVWLWDDARKHYLRLDPVSKLVGSGGSYGSHNQYIAWLLKNGLIGFIFFLFFLYKVILQLKPRPENDVFREPWIHFSLALFAVTVFLINLFSQPWDNTTFSIFFWSSIGIAVSLNNKNLVTQKFERSRS